MAKCVFCMKSSDEVVERDDSLLLCNECNEARNEAKLKASKEEEVKNMEENKVVQMVREDNVKEAEVVEITDSASEEQQSKIKAQMLVGMLDDGRLFFDVGGEDTNLVVLHGLVEFASRRIKQLWDRKDYEAALAQQEEQEAVQAEK